MASPSQLDDAGDAVRSVIRAFHGSPYDFDRFDASKIGTGEGAQAYGHGLYFAGNERVANTYRRQLAGDPMEMDLAIDGRPVFRDSWQTLPSLHKDGSNYLLSRLRNYSDEHAQAALEEIRRDLPGLLENARTRTGDDGQFAAERRLNEIRGAIDLLNNRRVSVLPSQRPGRTYEVEISHPDDSLLDWNAPIDAQSGRVRTALESLGVNTKPFYGEFAGQPVFGVAPTGRHAYQDAARMAGAHPASVTGPPAAAAALRDVGIPGLKYFDAGSRSAGAGTHNYVMFPGTEDSIRILRKYSLLAPMAAGAAMEDQ